MVFEEQVTRSCQKQGTHRKCLPSGSAKDLWLLVRLGTVSEVESALLFLKKNGGNINARNSFGLTPLHIAAWRNHIPIVRRLIAAGADPNARDGESGWSSLHRAFHFGHLAVASVLLQSGASLMLEDSKGRIPADLLSGPVLQAIGNEVSTEVFSWGSGVNYQLGTGNAHIQKLPCKVDALHGSFIKVVSASKFHSVAVTAQGEVYTWGFGRGGRLGHPDFDIHSGQAAVITPRRVNFGFGSRRVKVVAAAKHHTVVATVGGEVFTWGSNREGQLGYASVDTQPTPRKVSSLKSMIVAVAAANKHTAVISESGEVFTWGCNKEGQLGYGTSNSASNYTPRLVDYLKGKAMVAVAAAKYHTIVLGADGEVFTWGHRLVTPRRVLITRNIKKLGTTPLKFHRRERLHVVSVAAGVTHSMALTDDGALFFWRSSDPDFQCQQLFCLCRETIVSISAGKYWIAAVTVTGNVYVWDGKMKKDELPIANRLHGVKKATAVSVGETHLLVISSLYHPVSSSFVISSTQNGKEGIKKEWDELDEGFMFDGSAIDELQNPAQNEHAEKNFLPSLKSLCERVAIEHLLEPRNALPLLEIADSLGADDLKKHCEDIVIRDLDYILTASSHNFTSTSLDILVNLEKVLDSKSSESWSARRLPTPTATLPAIVHSEEENSDDEILRTRGSFRKYLSSEKVGAVRLDSFLHPRNIASDDVSREVRALKKKLQQIEMLEEKLLNGHALDDQQMKKVQTRSALESSLFELGEPIEKLQTKGCSSTSTDGKRNQKERLRKQKRKGKSKAAEMEQTPGNHEIVDRRDSSNSVLDVETSLIKHQDKGEDLVTDFIKPVSEDPGSCMTKDLLVSRNCKSSSPAGPKKKNRKGGLSVFLSGGLDDVPQINTAPPLVAKTEGPAWGGPKVSKSSTSLREIQDEESKKRGTMSTKSKDLQDDISDGTRLRLSSLLHSNPVPFTRTRTTQVGNAETHTPPWTASVTPPSLSRPSLRDIQLQQVKHHQAASQTPQSRTTGFSVTPGHQGLQSDSGCSNRWFKPEAETPSSIRSIQIEESAIKDLKRFYSSVKVVKNPT